MKTYIVNQRHPEASDTNSGDASNPFLTINHAAQLAEPGDTVQVHAGIYRERVAPKRGGDPDRPIRYQGVPGEEVVIRGSEIFTPEWKSVEGSENVVQAKLDSDLVVEKNLFNRKLKSMPGQKYCGQVFVDGQLLQQVDNEENVMAFPGTWMVQKEGTQLLIHFEPSVVPLFERLVEITVRDRNFASFTRGLGYIEVRGFVMEHCGNDFPIHFWEKGSEVPQAGALSCRGGHHWVIENNIIRHANTLGIDCGSEGYEDADGLGQPQPEGSGYHLIKDNTISDNGSTGMMGFHCVHTQIVGNVFERNNVLGFTAPETAAMKFHFFTDCLIEGNLIRENDTYGIWLDNVWHRTRITRNLIVSNQGAGIFIELGFGPMSIDNNVIAFTRATTSLAGEGIYSHDSSGITVAHNLLFFNANFGLWAHLATDRKTTTPQGTKEEIGAGEWQILNNIFLGNHRGSISLPGKSPRTDGHVSNHNVLAGAYELVAQESWAQIMDPPEFLLNTSKGRTERIRPEGNKPLFGLEEWRELTGWEQDSIYAKFLRPMLSVRASFLDLIIDPALKEMTLPRVPGVENDYFGSPIPESGALPGPFQTLEVEPQLSGEGTFLEFRGPYNAITGENMNRFHLWPLKVKSDRPIQTVVSDKKFMKRDF